MIVLGEAYALNKPWTHRTPGEIRAADRIGGRRGLDVGRAEVIPQWKVLGSAQGIERQCPRGHWVEATLEPWCVGHRVQHAGSSGHLMFGFQRGVFLGLCPPPLVILVPLRLGWETRPDGQAQVYGKYA